MSHRIFDVHYSKAIPSDESPLWCTCGWEGQVATFPAHRGEVGERRGLRNRVDPEYTTTARRAELNVPGSARPAAAVDTSPSGAGTHRVSG